jgi:hypothetical protein
VTDDALGRAAEREPLNRAPALCTAGEAETVVCATGMMTELGRSAAPSQRVAPEISPLQRQVNRAAQLIAVVAIACGVVFFAAGSLVAGLPIADAATFAIGLLVANVPEGCCRRSRWPWRSASAGWPAAAHWPSASPQSRPSDRPTSSAPTNRDALPRAKWVAREL